MKTTHTLGGLLKPLMDAEKVGKPCQVCGTVRPFHERNSAGVPGWNSCQLHEAAPELLAALEAAIPAMGVDISGMDVGAVITQARAALARAKGAA